MSVYFQGILRHINCRQSESRDTTVCKYRYYNQESFHRFLFSSNLSFLRLICLMADKSPESTKLLISASRAKYSTDPVAQSDGVGNKSLVTLMLPVEIYMLRIIDHLKRSTQIKAVKVHHFVPCCYEISDEFITGIRASIHFS